MKSKMIGLFFAAAVIIVAVACALLMRKPRRSMPPPPQLEDASSSVVPKIVTSSRPARPRLPVPAASGVSDAVRIAAGKDPETARFYSRRAAAVAALPRDLSASDAASLLAYVASTGDVLRAERVAALKNDALNVLRRQSEPVGALPSTLMAMLESRAYEPVMLDYCVQHLGAMLNGLDTETRLRVLSAVRDAAGETSASYAGTALYALADDRRMTADDERELRRLTVALANDPSANSAARISATILAGERGYSEVLPSARDIAFDESAPIPLRIAAIGALGALGSAHDLPLLERLASEDNLRLQPAIDSAVRRSKGRNMR